MAEHRTTKNPNDHVRVPLGDNAKSGRVKECAESLRKLGEVLVDEPHVAYALLRTCAAPAVKLRLLARCRADIDWEDVDDQLRAAVSRIVGGSQRIGDA